MAYFIDGFRCRQKGLYDQAERKYLEAYKLNPDNFHINREISSVLCRMGRYPEAEPYARAAYQRAQDNPYIIDVLIEAIEGIQSLGGTVDFRELQKLEDTLKVLCELGGFQFHNIREARKISKKDKVKSLAIIGDAIDSSKNEPDGYYRRAQMYIAAGDLTEARKDIDSLRKIGDKTKENLVYADELEIDCLIVEKRFSDAKEIIERRLGNASGISALLTKKLARAISYYPDGVPKPLRDWAKLSG